MHKDVKIGIVVGIVLAGVVVGYILFAGGGQTPSPTASDEALDADQINIPVREPVAPAIAAKRPEQELADLIVPHTAEPTTAPAAGAAAITRHLPADEAITPKLAPPPEPVQPAAGEIEQVIIVGLGEPPKTPARPRVYVVSADDTKGFWGIAETEYGHGKYYELIERANPGVDASALRPGQKLTLPPLPTRQPAVAAATGARRDVESAAAAKVYIVKPDDSLWKIAKRQYGRGDYLILIVQANPTLKPGSVIRPGQKLLIPPLSTRPGKSARGPASPTARTATLAGQSSYVVQAGDSFWTIAAARYGHGKYESLIARANPGVDPRKLKPGQKLVLPPMPAGGVAPAKSLPAEPDAGQFPRPSFDDYGKY